MNCIICGKEVEDGECFIVVHDAAHNDEKHRVHKSCLKLDFVQVYSGSRLAIFQNVEQHHYQHWTDRVRG